MRRSILRSTLLGATALSFAAVGAPAYAFDTINWNWDLDVQTNVTQTVDITATIVADSIAIIENEQIFVGAVTAESSVTGAVNVPFVDPTAPAVALSVDDLPKVESSAVAVANNANVESDVMTDINSFQATGYDRVVVPATFDPLTGQELTPEIVTYVVGAPVAITASSTVSGSVNVQVESTAQAIANNLSITLDGVNAADRVLKANNIQLANATVTAISTVTSPTVCDFSNLGTLATPWVSSSATAVGNNLQIKIKAGTAPLLPI